MLGAVVDAGVSLEYLNKTLSGLGVNGLSLESRIEQRGGVRGTLVFGNLDRRDEHLGGLQGFIRVVEDSTLSPKVVQQACAVFRRLNDAETAVHGVSKNEIQLHELGDLDTLVDVVGTVVGLEKLGIENLYCSPLPAGSGSVLSGHGVLTVPSPATAAIFALARAPVVAPPKNVSDAGEMVTPTGAALATVLATFEQPTMNVELVGYGLGARKSPYYPNVLQMWVGESISEPYVSDLRLIETNIDDTASEILGYVQEKLFDLGARDVWFTPIQMKKNRPAYMLSVLVPIELESIAVMLVMKETTSLGVRVRAVTRYEAEREILQVKTSFGIVSVKVKYLQGTKVSVSPEYDECRSIAIKFGVPLQEVYRVIQQEATGQLL